jgi:hypothetical protein
MEKRTGIVGSVWADIRHGKDIELYITVPLAIVVVTANLIGQAPASVISAVTLGILTLLIVALLKLRKQGDRLIAAVDRLEQPDNLISRTFHNEHDIEEIKTLIKESRSEVWLWGSILAEHVSVLAPYIERAVVRGLVIKVLLIKPAPSGVMAMAVLRAAHDDDNELQRELTANLFKLRQIANRISKLAAPQEFGRLEVGVIDYLAPYALYAYDPQLPTGRMDVRMAALQAKVDDRPTFTITTVNAGPWYQHFKGQFEAAWNLAEQVPANSKPGPSPQSGG